MIGSMIESLKCCGETDIILADDKIICNLVRGLSYLYFYSQVNFNFKPLTKSLTEGTLIVPQTIQEDSEDSDCEFVIEYVTDSEEED